MQFLQIKYPLPNREEEENNSNNKDDTDNDITGRTNFMLDNSGVILKWIEFLELFLMKSLIELLIIIQKIISLNSRG